MTGQSFWSYLKALPVIVISFLSPSALSFDTKNTELVLSEHTVGAFFRVAECVSIRASRSEKLGFLTSKIMSLEWDGELETMPSKEWFGKLIEEEQSDVDEIYTAIKKYCSESGRIAGEAMRIAVSADSSRRSQVDILTHFVVQIIASDVLDRETRVKIFENYYKAIGLDEVY